MDMASIDFGHDGMNEHAMAADILDVERYPTATYVGELARFVNGSPTAVEGSLTMHGVSRPVDLAIERFQCQPHSRHGREVCGADASTTINRDEFGVDYDKENGFFMAVKLLITIEAQIPAE
jgi:polyisoprenoid-binding protein YceI